MFTGNRKCWRCNLVKTIPKGLLTKGVKTGEMSGNSAATKHAFLSKTCKAKAGCVNLALKWRELQYIWF